MRRAKCAPKCAYFKNPVGTSPTGFSRFLWASEADFRLFRGLASGLPAPAEQNDAVN
jgi:hypothetical protein